MDVSERARLREAERALREVKMENEFLKKVRQERGRPPEVVRRLSVVLCER